MIMEFVTTLLIMSAVVSEIVSFWDEIIAGVQRSIEAVKKIVSGIVYGTRVFVKKVKGIVHRISRHYSYEEDKDQWFMTTQEVSVEHDEVPEDISQSNDFRTGNEVDISDEMKLELSNY